MVGTHSQKMRTSLEGVHWPLRLWWWVFKVGLSYNVRVGERKCGAVFLALFCVFISRVRSIAVLIRLYLKFETQFGSEDKEEFVQAFKRYLDDCFAIWNKSEEDLKKLHAMLNSLHESINFMVEYDNVKLPFLDVLVCKQNNKLNTDIFYKATDTNQYLYFNSCHPKHTKTNIPYSLARQICCIVSDADIKTKRLNELENFLVQQNYPKSLITKGVEKATSLSQEELRAPKNRNSNTKTLQLVLTHNPNNPQIINRIKQNLQFLKNSEKIKPILENTKLIVSRRQPKNLKKHLNKPDLFPRELPTL